MKCFDYALGRLRRDNVPFALLLPTYTATKQYFRQLLATHGLEQEDAAMVYIVPRDDYAYLHPEGTGKQVPPFPSMWFCGLPRGRHGDVAAYWKTRATASAASANLYLNLAQLEAAQVISTQHRPNPRQRKKQRQRLAAAAAAAATSPIRDDVVVAAHDNKSKTESTTTPSAKKKKKSKYRDNGGKRDRKRF